MTNHAVNPHKGLKWPFIKKLERMHQPTLILASAGISMALAGVFCYIGYLNGEHVHTRSDKWVAASKDYMRFQNINPIFGTSSKPAH